MRDIFALQDDITLAVVEALKVTLFGDARRLCAAPSDDADAYEHYLKGRFHSTSTRQRVGSWQLSTSKRLSEKQPDYALAYAGSGQPADVSGSLEFCPPSRRSRRAKPPAARR